MAAELLSVVSSKKSSAAHTAVITGRDTALQVGPHPPGSLGSPYSSEPPLPSQEYLCTVRTVVEECVKMEREEVASERRWWDSWTTSLARVRQLYQ